MKPWLQTWTGEQDEWLRLVVGDDDRSIRMWRLRALFAAAAPDMCRALLAVEWEGSRGATICPSCESGMPHYHNDLGHDTSCWLDKALTKAGLPDQASRDEARKELGI